MKKGLIAIIIIAGLSLTLYYKDVIKYIAYNFVYRYEVLEYTTTGYPKKGSYHFVQEKTDYYPKNKQEVLNIIYTAINNGWGEFSFFCDYNYESCEDDITFLAEENETLTLVNNYVHPFNSFDRLSISMNGLGKITITAIPLYTEDQINELNVWVDKILNEQITETMTTRTKLLTLHNYIIDLSSYDKERSDAIRDGIAMPNNYSHIAYGILSNQQAVCGGYTDLMAIFLEKLNIPNIKISTMDHIWNLVYYNDQWRHMDLTWDDPYTGTDKNVRIDHYFLIDTEKLWSLDKEQHLFDRNIFKEAN